MKMIEFIFFLTRNDVTISNAIDALEQIRDTEVKCVGFKDVGVSKEVLKELRENIREANKISLLEVVSSTKKDNLRAAELGKELDVDYVIGGLYVEEMLEVLKSTRIKFCPYIGRVVGHPCLQRGTIEEICEDAKRVEKLGVQGIDLLSYRYDGDPVQLTRAVIQAVRLPVIVAGNISSFEQIRTMMELGVWGFTAGTSILDKKFAPGGSIGEQIEAVLNQINAWASSLPTDRN